MSQPGQVKFESVILFQTKRNPNEHFFFEARYSVAIRCNKLTRMKSYVMKKLRKAASKPLWMRAPTAFTFAPWEEMEYCGHISFFS